MAKTAQAVLEEVYADWGSGDYSKSHYLHPDFELVLAPGFLEEGTFLGREAAWRGWKNWLDQWASWRYKPVGQVDLDDGRIAVFIDIEGVSKTTGLELSQHAANLFEFEDGLVKRCVAYAHRDDMTRELGIDPP